MFFKYNDFYWKSCSTGFQIKAIGALLIGSYIRNKPLVRINKSSKSKLFCYIDSSHPAIRYTQFRCVTDRVMDYCEWKSEWFPLIFID